jgi:carboxypeptidase C (cathepsin A)
MNTAGKKDAPTVIWHQGGPGGSSMIGFFTENGPLTVNDFSFLTSDYNKTGIPTVFDNPYSWTNVANMIYVEHPGELIFSRVMFTAHLSKMLTGTSQAPTGFSYCDGECVWDDWNQAQVNYAFIVSFFEKYPELASNDFFYSGESYAGVLVPTVSLQIAAHTTDANKDKAPWNLGGFMLGNDCPGNHIFTCTPYSGWIGTQVALEFRFRHGNVVTKQCETRPSIKPV